MCRYWNHWYLKTSPIQNHLYIYVAYGCHDCRMPHKMFSQLIHFLNLTNDTMRSKRCSKPSSQDHIDFRLSDLPAGQMESVCTGDWKGSAELLYGAWLLPGQRLPGRPGERHLWHIHRVQWDSSTILYCYSKGHMRITTRNRSITWKKEIGRGFGPNAGRCYDPSASHSLPHRTNM